QAEDGIRDGHVTGVQTCALPIFITSEPIAQSVVASMLRRLAHWLKVSCGAFSRRAKCLRCVAGERRDFRPRAKSLACAVLIVGRSEERRVGKECRWREAGVTFRE